VDPDKTARVLEEAVTARVPARVIGRTIDRVLSIALEHRVVINLTVDDAEQAWSSAIDRRFVRKVA
jgi:hypothetical protein